MEINEELEMHEKGWIIQRVGWVILLLIMAAGALGLFGEGWLSDQTPSNGDVKVEYQRFYRYESEMKILIESRRHISTVSLPQQYIKDFRLLRFEPEPENNTTNNGEVTFNFLPAQNQVVTVYIIPKTYGSIEGTLKVNGTINFNLHHFIYP